MDETNITEMLAHLELVAESNPTDNEVRLARAIKLLSLSTITILNKQGEILGSTLETLINANLIEAPTEEKQPT